jgi:hypothetical protein
VFDSPEPCEDYRDMFATPPRAPVRARNRPAQPADPVPPAEHRSHQARSAGRQLATCFAWRVAARGRAASPTKRGRIVLSDKDLSPICLQ